ncbi:MAG: CBS domain-containing protein [Vicinamibacteraceae bacterium]
MRVNEIMTKSPACCTPDTPLAAVASLMVEHDCGEIPIVDGIDTMRPMGVVTDRDIVCRVVARDKNPLGLVARDCMTSPVVTVTPGASVDDCARGMAEYRVRRIPVIDNQGRLCGMVSQADLALAAPRDETADVVRRISEPTSPSSTIADVVQTPDQARL